MKMILLRTRWLLLLAGMAMLPSSLLAEVKLASPFTSHMVLQRDAKAPVWGRAGGGEMVTVTFAGQKISAQADAAGNWRVDLAPLTASKGGRGGQMCTS